VINGVKMDILGSRYQKKERKFVAFILLDGQLFQNILRKMNEIEFDLAFSKLSKLNFQFSMKFKIHLNLPLPKSPLLLP